MGIYPADSVFWFARQGRFDAVLSLYHDQGHIATKCMDFIGTVSITLGLLLFELLPIMEPLLTLLAGKSQPS